MAIVVSESVWWLTNCMSYRLWIFSASCHCLIVCLEASFVYRSPFSWLLITGNCLKLIRCLIEILRKIRQKMIYVIPNMAKNVRPKRNDEVLCRPGFPVLDIATQKLIYQSVCLSVYLQKVFTTGSYLTLLESFSIIKIKKILRCVISFVQTNFLWSVSRFWKVGKIMCSVKLCSVFWYHKVYLNLFWT